MKLVAATNNRGKLAEIRRIMGAAGYQVLSMQEAGVELEIAETGETYAANAIIKARAVCQATGMPSLGDDSGLEVDALDGAPGVYSARFAGKNGDSEANNKHLLYLLERTPYVNRTARFVCVVALALPDDALLQADGSCEGMIGFGKSGENGFGYDPLFFVNGYSFADMNDEEKDKISHRGKALQSLVKKLPGFINAHPAAFSEE